MHDVIETDPLPAGSPALRQIYDLIAVRVSARDAERAYPLEAVGQLRPARFGTLRLLLTEEGGGWHGVSPVLDKI